MSSGVIGGGAPDKIYPCHTPKSRSLPVTVRHDRGGAPDVFTGVERPHVDAPPKGSNHPLSSSGYIGGVPPDVLADLEGPWLDVRLREARTTCKKLRCFT